MQPDQTALTKASYDAHLPSFNELEAEVRYALDKALRAADLKTHNITSRVKSFQSLLDKADRKDYAAPLEQVEDIVGVRIVVLFLSDLPKVETVIRDTFDIQSSEDMVEGQDPQTFGYMSVHYNAKLPATYTGARYDSIKGKPFEIQVRTIVMDAWANVSHYLAYKGESSIPTELRRDFFALSGLFYVADQHFELFASRAAESASLAEEQVSEQPDATGVEINVDTMLALLRSRFASRDEPRRSDASELVEEVTEAGYSDLDQVLSEINRAEHALAAYEAGRDRPFAAVGAARISLALANPDYARSKYSFDTEESWREYRELLLPG